jgi:hypothetical protein
MRRLPLFIMVLLLASRLHAGEVLDRIVVTVNGNALLQSDWDAELRYECFISGHVTNNFSMQERRAALNRVIDQELVREQIRPADFTPAGSQDVEAQIAQMKSQHEQGSSGQTWQAGLLACGLHDDDFRKHVQLELDQLRAIHARLSPSIQIDAPSVEAYYRKKIANQTSGAKPLSFAEAEPKIRKILTEERINQLLDSWLESLRSQAKIRIYAPELSALGQEP